MVTKSEAGGAQTHVCQLAGALGERGDEPLIMAQPGGWLERAAADLGVDFCPNPPLSNRIELFESQPKHNGVPIGVLVAERRIDEVAAAIERLVCDTQLRIDMGHSAAARATESFSLDAMVQRTFHAYEQALR